MVCFIFHSLIRHIKYFIPSGFFLWDLLVEHGWTISSQKAKLIALNGRDPVKSKIVPDNKIEEQVNSFNYLGNSII